MTCGGGMYGADVHLKHLLNKAKIGINALFELKMTDNYILLYNVVDAETQRLDLINAEVKLEIIISAVYRYQKIMYKSSLVGKIVTLFGQPIYRLDRRTKKFTTNNRCTGCGKCAMNCPVKAIVIKNKKPVWVKKRCVHCLGCINRCPTIALQYGKATENKRRFVNQIFK